jgi:hypothetical protein
MGGLFGVSVHSAALHLHGRQRIYGVHNTTTMSVSCLSGTMLDTVMNVRFKHLNPKYRIVSNIVEWESNVATTDQDQSDPI